MLRIYPFELVVNVGEIEVARHRRCFEHERICYDWQHYIGLIQRKPGALRNGAPFLQMPAALRHLQRRLLSQPRGDRAMATVLAVVPVHGLESVLVAAELVLESGRVSADHLLNMLSRLNHPLPVCPRVVTDRPDAPAADTVRYERLREVHDVS